MERDVQAGLGAAVVAERVAHQRRRALEPERDLLAIAGQRPERPEGGQEDRQHRHDGRWRLAVVGHGEALAQAGQAVELELHDDRAGDVGILGPRDAKRIAERHLEDLGPHRQRHRPSSKELRIRAKSSCGPKR